MAPLEPWEKVYITEDYFDSIHAQASCVDCHGGVQVADKAAAHEGLITDPAADAEKVCGTCHGDQTATYANALHSTQAGYWDSFVARGADISDPALNTMFDNHCATCHTSCGECHISQPNNVGGGLLDGHNFVKTPPMTRTCTACHGSRVGNEYMGKNEGFVGDVHFRSARMKCTDCHTGSEMHDSMGATHRYDGAENPKCTSCHAEVGTASDTISQHALHQDKLSCQVCHSITYSNCDSCHVSISEETGKPKFKTASTYFTFYIGKNPLQSDGRPYEYVPVRHVPVDPESYSYYGENLLPDFNAATTWRYTTPHNIQRNTPQTETCNSCHGNVDIFLTADKVKPEELDANIPVIVESVPAPVGN